MATYSEHEQRILDQVSGQFDDQLRATMKQNYQLRQALSAIANGEFPNASSCTQTTGDRTMIKVIFANSAGELDSRTVEAPCDVREAILSLINGIDEFYHGDKIVVVNMEED